MKEVTYKGQKCLIVFFIPEFDSKGKRQSAEPRFYLSHPFNFTVPVAEFKGDRGMVKNVIVAQ
jgi:hypothetical protein